MVDVLAERKGQLHRRANGGNGELHRPHHLPRNGTRRTAVKPGQIKADQLRHSKLVAGLIDLQTHQMQRKSDTSGRGKIVARSQEAVHTAHSDLKSPRSVLDFRLCLWGWGRRAMHKRRSMRTASAALSVVGIIAIQD